MDALPASTPYETAACITQAAERYTLPKLALYAIAAKEAGFAGLRRKNSNGTYDMGRMQINTANLKELRPFGITEELLLTDECTNVQVGAWKLARYLSTEKGDWWRAIARYNVGSLNTEARARIGTKYASDVIGYWTYLYQQQN